MFRTTDRGGVWAPVTDTLGESNVYDLAADPVDSDTIYTVADTVLTETVFKTGDGGRTWAEASRGLPYRPDIYALVVDPTDPRILYAGIQSSGVFKSADAGETWVPANEGIADLTIYSLAVDPTMPQTVYAGAETGIYKSKDGGQSWVHHGLGLGSAGYIEALVVDPSNPDVVYAGGYSGGCCSPERQGRPSPATYPRIRQRPKGTSEDDDGVFKSTDGGQTWVRSSNGINHDQATSVSALAIDPSSPGTLYAAVSCTYYEECGDTDVYRTSDGGSSWTSALYVYGWSWFSSIVIDPFNTQVVYAGHADGGVYRSTDAGASWEAINDGFPEIEEWVNALVIAPTDRLYAGTLDGVFEFVE
jgi:photosystem II stability/assembly factor-like uncharacterized protein